MDSTIPDVYYFYCDSAFLEKNNNKKYTCIKVPHPPKSYWRNDSNPNFICAKPNTSQEKDVIFDMTKTLIEFNPREDVDDLHGFATVIYRRNCKIVRNRNRYMQRKRAKKQYKKTKQQKATKLNKVDLNDSSLNSSFNVLNEINAHSNKVLDYNSGNKTFSKTKSYLQKGEDCFEAGISLHTPLFKLDPSVPHMLDLSIEDTTPLPDVVDLCSDADTTVNMDNSDAGSSNIWNNNLKFVHLYTVIFS